MQYKNRYGDIIICTKIDDNHYELKSTLKLGNWETFEDCINYNQGGPTISLNSDLGLWFEELKGKKVKSIKFNEGVILEV